MYLNQKSRPWEDGEEATKPTTRYRSEHLCSLRQDLVILTMGKGDYRSYILSIRKWIIACWKGKIRKVARRFVVEGVGEGITNFP